MASSLQPQLKMLVSSNEQYCSTLSGSYLRSILDCAYAFGAAAGILWGYLADRWGRRPIALIGLYGMSACCLSMGFATNLIACTILRFVAGLISSSIVVSTLTMLGDVSQSPEERIKNVSRLPLVAVCGSIGPLVQGMVAGSINAHGAIWARFPILSSQIACGSLVLIIAIAATFLLKEVGFHICSRLMPPRGSRRVIRTCNILPQLGLPLGKSSVCKVLLDVRRGN